jgi:Rrf2 family protein
MNISSRCDYAVRAVVELARRAQSDTPHTATAIAQEQNIPEKYLVHILLQLKRGGIVRSVRGAHGGYLLAQPPRAISLLDVVTAVEGPILEPLPGVDSASGEVVTAWRKVARALSESLAAISIQSILDEAAKPDMYFI